MAAVDVGSIDEFPEHQMRIVRAREHEVGILRWDGNVYAIRNYCPHQGGPVCTGRVYPKMSGDPLKLEVDAGSPVITCGWHGWEFDPRSGAAISGTRSKVKTWPARVTDGRVQVEMARAD